MRNDSKNRIRELEDELERFRRDWERLGDFLYSAGVKLNRQDNVCTKAMEYCNGIMEERNKQFSQLELEGQRVRAAESAARAAESEARAAQTEAKNNERGFQLQTKELNHARQEVHNLLGQLHTIGDESNRVVEEARAAFEKDMRRLEENLRIVQQEKDAELLRLQKAHHAELASQGNWHKRELAEGRAFYEKTIAKLTEETDIRVAETAARYEASCDDIAAQHINDVKSLQERVADLEGDLLSQSDDFRPATDQVLKSRFTDLKSLIKRVALPQNLNLGPMLQLPRILDPNGFYSGFLETHGSKHLQFVLRHLFWNVLRDAFFSLPFGFGFLGRDMGQRELLEMNRAWLQLYGAPDTASEFGTIRSSLPPP